MAIVDIAHKAPYTRIGDRSSWPASLVQMNTGGGIPGVSVRLYQTYPASIPRAARPQACKGDRYG
jgi:hypothetical protein